MRGGFDASQCEVFMCKHVRSDVKPSVTTFRRKVATCTCTSSVLIQSTVCSVDVHQKKPSFPHKYRCSCPKIFFLSYVCGLVSHAVIFFYLYFCSILRPEVARTSMFNYNM